jgi:DNA-binding PadR family transcriptional regulator
MYERKILLGFIRIHILHHAAHDPHGVYGGALIDELKTHGYKISPGTLYPILHEMKKDHMIQDKKEIIKGKQRIIYTITTKGEQTLTHLKQYINELSKEVI